jgi:hypothetical protein
MRTEWFRPKDGGEYAGDVGERTFRTWLTKGLKYAKVGGVVLIRRDWIDEFLEAHASTKEANRVERIADEMLK